MPGCFYSLKPAPFFAYFNAASITGLNSCAVEKRNIRGGHGPALLYKSVLYAEADRVIDERVIFLFGESPVALQLLGGALILGGVVFYSVIEKKDA